MKRCGRKRLASVGRKKHGTMLFLADGPFVDTHLYCVGFIANYCMPDNPTAGTGIKGGECARQLFPTQAAVVQADGH